MKYDIDDFPEIPECDVIIDDNKEKTLPIFLFFDLSKSYDDDKKAIIDRGIKELLTLLKQRKKEERRVNFVVLAISFNKEKVLILPCCSNGFIPLDDLVINELSIEGEPGFALLSKELESIFKEKVKFDKDAFIVTPHCFFFTDGFFTDDWKENYVSLLKTSRLFNTAIKWMITMNDTPYNSNLLQISCGKGGVIKIEELALQKELIKIENRRGQRFDELGEFEEINFNLKSFSDNETEEEILLGIFSHIYWTHKDNPFVDKYELYYLFSKETYECEKMKPYQDALYVAVECGLVDLIYQFFDNIEKLDPFINALIADKHVDKDCLNKLIYRISKELKSILIPPEPFDDGGF